MVFVVIISQLIYICKRYFRNKFKFRAFQTVFHNNLRNYLPATPASTVHLDRIPPQSRPEMPSRTVRTLGEKPSMIS